MGKYDLSAVVLCPFYRHEDSHKIICETPDDTARLHLTFSEPRLKLEYEKKYCKCRNYESCIVARINTEFWEELE